MPYRRPRDHSTRQPHPPLAQPARPTAAKPYTTPPPRHRPGTGHHDSRWTCCCGCHGGAPLGGSGGRPQVCPCMVICPADRDAVRPGPLRRRSSSGSCRLWCRRPHGAACRPGSVCGVLACAVTSVHAPPDGLVPGRARPPRPAGIGQFSHELCCASSCGLTYHHSHGCPPRPHLHRAHLDARPFAPPPRRRAVGHAARRRYLRHPPPLPALRRPPLGPRLPGSSRPRRGRPRPRLGSRCHCRPVARSGDRHDSRSAVSTAAHCPAARRPAPGSLLVVARHGGEGAGGGGAGGRRGFRPAVGGAPGGGTDRRPTALSRSGRGGARGRRGDCSAVAR